MLEGLVLEGFDFTALVGRETVFEIQPLADYAKANGQDADTALLGGREPIPSGNGVEAGGFGKGGKAVVWGYGWR
jgi:hypothetical protein